MAKHPHTPGPWSLDDDLSVYADVGVFICEVTGAEDFPCIEEGTENDVQAECLANGHLIAAAPQMLEQCKLFERVIKYQIKVSTTKGDDEGARLQSLTLHHLREVITRAEGGAA